MIQARLSLVQALDTAAAQCKHKHLKNVIETVRRDVQRGKSLAGSLARHGWVFNDLYVHLVRVGEMAGILDQVLLRLAIHLEKTTTLKRKVSLALFYPALILTVAIGAVIFFLSVIVPTFAEMYADFGHALPGPTQVVLRLSEVLTDSFFGVLLAMSGVVTAGSLFLRSTKGRLVGERLKLRVPLLGGVLRKSMTAAFCRTVGTLLSSGVALVDALSIQAKATGNTYVEQVLNDVLRRVRRGSSLYQPLKKAGIFPDMVVQLIAVGEETADLDGMLLHAATHYEDEVDMLLDGLTSVIEPVLIIIIGIMLGGILVALYLPMFEMINAVG